MAARNDDDSVDWQMSPAKRLKGIQAPANLPPRQISGVFRPSHLRKPQPAGGDNAASDASHQDAHRVPSDAVVSAFLHRVPWSVVDMRQKSSSTARPNSPTPRGSAADPDLWERKLFVSNLPYGCTEDKLHDYFSKNVGGEVEECTEDKLHDYFSKNVGGEVEDVSLMRDKKDQLNGKANILFYDPEAVGIAAQSAHYIDGQILNIEPGKPRITMPPKKKHNAEQFKTPSTPRASVDHLAPAVLERKIFVGCLPDACTSEQLSEYFSTVAPVEDAVVLSHQQTNTPRGCGHVLFQDSTGQDLAMEAFSDGLLEIDGSTLEVRKWSTGRKKGWVTGIALSCTEAEIYGAFGQYGEVEKVDLRNGQPKVAFVTFVHTADLDRALGDQCEKVKFYSQAFSKKTRIHVAEVSTSKREKARRKNIKRQATRRLKDTQLPESDNEQSGSASG